MEQTLQLCIFTLLIQVSHAVWQHVTVIKGQTLDLSCPITNPHQTNVEWKNPEGYIMFFKHKTGPVITVLKNKRYSVSEVSKSEFTVSIFDVTFEDGGNYTCSHYDNHTTDRTVEVTVVGRPKVTIAQHEGRFEIRCTAEGNYSPPQIWWKLDHGPEILDFSQVFREDTKYVSRAMLHVQSVKNRATVKCIVRHLALYSQPLMDFIKIGQKPTRSHCTTTTHASPAQPKESTGMQRTTTDWKSVTLTGSHLSTNDNSRTSSQSGSTRTKNDTFSSNAANTTSWTSVYETTEEITSHNFTEENRTGIFKDLKTGNEGRSSLLVFLVTCLIVGLLVVVIFFAIKLRRAHITWKRENEDSNPSEESSKSKSSQEEKNSQGQRRRGLSNTAFTQYVNEEPLKITSVINTAAMAAIESVNKEQASQLQKPQPTSAKCDIKETEL